MVLPDGAIVQIRVWLVTEPVPPSEHRFKYSLYHGRNGERPVAYDHERGRALAMAMALKRDYSNVHADVQALTDAGLIERSEDGDLRAEYDGIQTRIAL